MVGKIKGMNFICIIKTNYLFKVGYIISNTLIIRKISKIILKSSIIKSKY